jgi:CRISPR type IV-associated protein Csf2
MSIFNDQDFTEINEQYTTINMKNTFNITAITVSPLLQLDLNGKQRKKFVLIDDEHYLEPFFSANGLRGILRRIMTKDMVEIIRKKNPKFNLTPEDFYLYTSGSSTDKKSINTISWKKVEEIREKAPILSLFGAGLTGISGKCAISDLKPISSITRYKIIQNNDAVEIKKAIPLTNYTVFFRTDDLQKNTDMQNLVDQDDIKKWQNKYYKDVKISKSLKENGDINSEKTSHIAQVIEIESIIPNVTLTSSINPLYGHKFTDIELGLFLKALIELSKQQIGASKRLGYGILDWHIELNGESMFSTICDKEYIFNKKIEMSKKCSDYIHTYEEWADRHYESLDIAKF